MLTSFSTTSSEFLIRFQLLIKPRCLTVRLRHVSVEGLQEQDSARAVGERDDGDAEADSWRLPHSKQTSLAFILLLRHHCEEHGATLDHNAEVCPAVGCFCFLNTFQR